MHNVKTIIFHIYISYLFFNLTHISACLYLDSNCNIGLFVAGRYIVIRTHDSSAFSKYHNKGNMYRLLMFSNFQNKGNMLKYAK